MAGKLPIYADDIGFEHAILGRGEFPLVRSFSPPVPNFLITAAQR
jgi:hypothetical protein